VKWRGAVQYHLYQLETTYDSSNIYYRNQSLCETVAGNSVPLLTVTSHPLTYDRDGVQQLSTLHPHTCTRDECWLLQR